MNNHTVKSPTIVSPEKWLAARREFLREEKEFSKLRDRLAARRRELPWVKVDQPYVFESPQGPVSLADLFEGRSQLIVYHFMLGPGWEEGCRGCSYVSDHFDWGAAPPERPRCRLHGGLVGPARGNRALQGTDGLGIPVGVVARQLVQPRLPGVLHPGGSRSRPGRLQLRPDRNRGRRNAGNQCLRARRRWRRLSDLLDLFARPRYP